MNAKLVGVGLGPGDPDLITLKGARYIQQADVICFIANEQGYSFGKDIAQAILNDCTQKAELPIVINMNAKPENAVHAYAQAAKDIEQYVNNGKLVVFLCEGDPLFFGSFGYVLEQLKMVIRCDVIPGISSVMAAASAIQKPLTMLQESFAVVSGRHNKETLVDVLNKHDSVVIMKAGRKRQTIIDAISAANRSHETHYLENISLDNQYMVDNLDLLSDETGPYFSLFVVTRSKRER